MVQTRRQSAKMKDEPDDDATLFFASLMVGADAGTEEDDVPANVPTQLQGAAAPDDAARSEAEAPPRETKAVHFSDDAPGAPEADVCAPSSDDRAAEAPEAAAAPLDDAPAAARDDEQAAASSAPTAAGADENEPAEKDVEKDEFFECDLAAALAVEPVEFDDEASAIGEADALDEAQQVPKAQSAKKARSARRSTMAFKPGEDDEEDDEEETEGAGEGTAGGEAAHDRQALRLRDGAVHPAPEMRAASAAEPVEFDDEASAVGEADALEEAQQVPKARSAKARRSTMMFKPAMREAIVHTAPNETKAAAANKPAVKMTLVKKTLVPEKKVPEKKVPEKKTLVPAEKKKPAEKKFAEKKAPAEPRGLTEPKGPKLSYRPPRVVVSSADVESQLVEAAKKAVADRIAQNRKTVAAPASTAQQRFGRGRRSRSVEPAAAQPAPRKARGASVQPVPRAKDQAKEQQAKRLTIAKPFVSAMAQRAAERLAGAPPPPPPPSPTLAEKLAKLAADVPSRFRRASVAQAEFAARQKEHEAGQKLGLTIPQSPALMSKIRERKKQHESVALAAPPTVDGLGGFKALLLDPRVLNCAGTHGVPRVASAPTTSPRPFAFTCDKRADARPPPPPSADEVELSKKFQARKHKNAPNVPGNLLADLAQPKQPAPASAPVSAPAFRARPMPKSEAFKPAPSGKAPTVAATPEMPGAQRHRVALAAWQENVEQLRAADLRKAYKHSPIALAKMQIHTDARALKRRAFNAASAQRRADREADRAAAAAAADQAAAAELDRLRRTSVANGGLRFVAREVPI